MATARKAPWNKKNPKEKSGKPTKHLTTSQKASAKRAAKKAGRKYPSLVDNMNAAKKKGTAKNAAKKSPAKKRSAKKKAAKKK